MLEADENGDGFHDDEDFEVDTPKRKHRNKGRVSDESDSSKRAAVRSRKRKIKHESRRNAIFCLRKLSNEKM